MNQQPITIAELLRESVIFQGILAVVALVGTFVLLLFGHFIPDYIWIIDGTVIGYFFGAKNLLTARNGAQEMGRVAETLAVQNAQIVKILSAPPGTPMGNAVAQAMRETTNGQTGRMD